MAKAKDYGKTMKILTHILKRLFAGEALSVKELAQEYGVSERTIQRYFNNYLKNAGFELKKIGRRWVLDSKQLGIIKDEESRLAIEAIMEIAKESGGGFYEKVQPYLQKLFYSSFNPFYTKLNLEDISDKLNEIAILEKAIKEKRVIACDYKLQEKEGKNIWLKPLRMVNFSNFWYLVAFDARNDIIKKYYLKHINNVKLLSKHFQVSEDIERRIKNAVNIWFDPNKEPFEVILFADSVAAPYLKRQSLSPTMYISGEDSDGSCEVRISITHYMEIIPFIKEWIPHIFVIEPKELKEIIKKDVIEYLQTMDMARL